MPSHFQRVRGVSNKATLKPTTFMWTCAKMTLIFYIIYPSSPSPSARREYLCRYWETAGACQDGFEQPRATDQPRRQLRRSVVLVVLVLDRLQRQVCSRPSTVHRPRSIVHCPPSTVRPARWRLRGSSETDCLGRGSLVVPSRATGPPSSSDRCCR